MESTDRFTVLHICLLGLSKSRGGCSAAKPCPASHQKARIFRRLIPVRYRSLFDGI